AHLPAAPGAWARTDSALVLLASAAVISCGEPFAARGVCRPAERLSRRFAIAPSRLVVLLVPTAIALSRSVVLLAPTRIRVLLLGCRKIARGGVARRDVMNAMTVIDGLPIVMFAG